MFFVTVFLLFVLFLLLKTAVIIPARQACIKERLGKFDAILEPGFHILIPFVDRIAYRHEMREQVLDVPPQSCITRDNIQVEVDGILYIKVMNAKRASYGIENYHIAAVNLAQTTMRSELGKLTLHQSFSERDNLNHMVVREIDKASEPWGIKVLRYEIMNITPSAHVIHTLEQQMEAERDRRAEVTMATAEKEALTTVSEGHRQEVTNVSEGEKQKRINEAEGKAGEISIIADATAFSVARVAQAISKPGGDAAVKMRILEQYIDELGRIVGESGVTVVPADLANIKGFFEGIGRVSSSMSGKALGADMLDTISYVIWIILGLIFVFKLFRSIRIVPQRFAMIVERLGKYHNTLNSGLHILFPFLDNVVAILDLKEETIEVPPQECFTKDEVKVMVDGVIYISVMDPVKAYYGVTDYKFGAMQLAQTTTRSVIGKLPLDRTFEERELISAKVVEVLSETGQEWGIQVHRYEIKNIQPPHSVQASMEKQVTAERERKAIIAKAEGDKQSRINRSEGLKAELINKSEGEKQKRINEAEGKAGEIRAIAEATAVSIEKVALAIAEQNGSEAVRLQLVEHYLRNLASIARQDTEVILPADLTNVSSLLESAGLDK